MWRCASGGGPERGSKTGSSLAFLNVSTDNSSYRPSGPETSHQTLNPALFHLDLLSCVLVSLKSASLHPIVQATLLADTYVFAPAASSAWNILLCIPTTCCTSIHIFPEHHIPCDVFLTPLALSPLSKENQSLSLKISL